MDSKENQTTETKPTTHNTSPEAPSATDAKRQAEALANDSESSMEPATPLSAEGSTPTPSGPMMSSGALAILVVFICALIAGGIYWWSIQGNLSGGNNTQEINLGAATGGSSTATPLEEIPDVVATVNGVDVPKEKLVDNIMQIESVITQQGQDPTNPSIAGQVQTQALDQTINNEVLAQAAANAGITITDAEVAAELESIRGQFADDASFEAELTNAGLTIEQLENNLGQQLAINQFIESADSVANLPEVTAEDAQAAYDQVASQGGADDLPSFAEVESQIVTQLTQQNRQIAITELIDALREAADIEVLF
jgi:peptidyl-prolyl cis-trans isomerase SurA